MSRSFSRNWIKNVRSSFLQTMLRDSSKFFISLYIRLISLKERVDIYLDTEWKEKKKNGNKRYVWWTNVLCSICLFDKDLSTQHTLKDKQSHGTADSRERNSWTTNLHLSAILLCYFSTISASSLFSLLWVCFLEKCLRFLLERFYRT